MLKKGVKVWNEWYGRLRSKEPPNVADLTGADLSGLDLDWVRLEGADLTGAISTAQT